MGPFLIHEAYTYSVSMPIYTASKQFSVFSFYFICIDNYAVYSCECVTVNCICCRKIAPLCIDMKYSFLICGHNIQCAVSRENLLIAIFSEIMEILQFCFFFNSHGQRLHFFLIFFNILMLGYSFIAIYKYYVFYNIVF